MFRGAAFGWPIPGTGTISSPSHHALRTKQVRRPLILGPRIFLIALPQRSPAAGQCIRYEPKPGPPRRLGIEFTSYPCIHSYHRDSCLVLAVLFVSKLRPRLLYASTCGFVGKCCMRLKSQSAPGPAMSSIRTAVSSKHTASSSLPLGTVSAAVGRLKFSAVR